MSKPISFSLRVLAEMAHLERIWLIPVFETVWGRSFGDGSEDDLEDISLDV